ncbi:hypothetical protein SEA_RANDO14_60 [Mycobacterium phage Rando14]|uniref:Uncharacterized protein n=1 Tax=Mycobacterium phage Rando14 TaxID=2301556 RepID=A0A385D530_9CAUD|nr:hypothetical protein I5G75_gp36 [Mycobacterium phage Rando14]AXQ53080.1 hypothetical protein SEA_RANDO14_60 [Mycobacterium phage Rando14]
MQHDCDGDDCGVCDARITEREYHRDIPVDVPDFYDGT